MGVSCQILIRKPREGVHKAGGQVTGIVRYAIDEPSRYKDIVLSLVGKGKCSWSESRKSHRRNGRETVTYTGTEIYTSQHLSICDKGPGPAFILPIGSYEYPFRFFLPQNIPSSFENDVCSIKYKIVLKFERPHILSFNKKFDTEIYVYSNVSSNYPEGKVDFGLQKTLFKPFRKRTHFIDLKATVENVIFAPGQNAEMTYIVTNDTDVTIASVRTELTCHTTYTANCGRRKQTSTTIKECTVETPSVPDNAVANMSNAVPIVPHLYSIQNSRIMFNEYKLKVTVRLPLPYINSSTETLIVIGDRFGVNDVERAVQEIEDEPPSYFEVMKEDNEND